MDKACIIVSESFISCDEKELRENIQKAVDEYIRLAAGMGDSHEMRDLLPFEQGGREYRE